MEALLCLAFPLSLKVHVHLQCLLMYCHRDPPDDPHHPVDLIPEKRLADQKEKTPCQFTYLLYEIILAEIDCFCKDILMLTRK